MGCERRAGEACELRTAPERPAGHKPLGDLHRASPSFAPRTYRPLRTKSCVVLRAAMCADSREEIFKCAHILTRKIVSLPTEDAGHLLSSQRVKSGKLGSARQCSTVPTSPARTGTSR